MTLYTDLDIAPDATPEQIKAAHLKMVKMHHPDRGGDINKFILAMHAYSVLSDPDIRALYDKSLKPAPAHKHDAGGNWNEP